MNWPVIILLGIAAIALIAFLVVKNKKDRKQLEQQLNNDYPKAKNGENESLPGDTP